MDHNKAAAGASLAPAARGTTIGTIRATRTGSQHWPHQKETMKLKKSVKQLCAEAEAQIETWDAQTAIAHRDDADVQLVDIRDVRELWREGGIPGALHAPRGMLEFWVDPESRYAKEAFKSGKRFVFFCAGGGRSALAAKAVQDMGLEPVCHIRGGFKAWKEAGGPIVPIEQKPPSTADKRSQT